ncbi:MAG TPA: RNA polymerase sigma-70 factor [Bacteroidales bacterium]|nr:RNA polymerase sigma-70 factor [Bacteroidales bacterium]
MSEPIHIDLEGIRRGDEDMFEKAFHGYFEKICCFAGDYVTDREVAREIAQEAFIKLWELRATLEDGSDIPALLFTIARNYALNHLKHLTIREKYRNYSERNYVESQLNLIALSDMQVEQIFGSDMQMKINKAIDDLPEKCKEVFMMSRNFAMSYKEIAEQLNISVRTVENHIAEALKRLRAKINPGQSHKNY